MNNDMLAKNLMKKILSFIFITLLLIGDLGFAGFYIWSQQTYEASEELYNYIDTDEIQYEENWLVFEPIEETKGGVILYPGTKVEPEAYSYYAQGLADNGYTVVIPKDYLGIQIHNLLICIH